MISGHYCQGISVGFYIDFTRSTSFSRTTKAVRCISTGSVGESTNVLRPPVRTLFHLARALGLSFRGGVGMEGIGDDIVLTNVIDLRLGECLLACGDPAVMAVQCVVPESQEQNVQI
jgi:hypothetical protein